MPNPSPLDAACKHECRHIDNEYDNLASAGSLAVYECVKCGVKVYEHIPRPTSALDVGAIRERCERAKKWPSLSNAYTVIETDLPAALEEIERLRREAEGYRNALAGIWKAIEAEIIKRGMERPSHD